MQWQLAVLLSTALLAYFWFWPKRRPTQNGRPLPKPSDTLPIIGNALRFLQPRHALFSWFLTQQTHFGDKTYAISVPSLPPGVVISSPKNLEFVLKNESIITKGEFFRTRAWDLFGHGIINATGPLWRAQRKAGLHFFNGATLDTLVEEVLPELWDEIVAPHLNETSNGSASLDLQRVFHDLTTALMGQTAYNLPKLTAAHPFSRAFDYASGCIASRFQNPLYPLTELLNGSKFRSAIREVKRFGLHIVSAAKRRRGHLAFESLLEGNDAPQFSSLIDSLIDSLSGSDDLVADAAMNFLSAGRDTTSENLTWTVYALLRNPDALQRLRKELSASMPAIAKDDDPITLTHLQPTTSPYLHATIYESLRLYPPVPIEIQQAEADLTLPDGTFLPRNSIVVWCIHALNRSAVTWSTSATDAEQYRPDRWLDPSSGAFTPRSAFEFPVFNGGPRMCLGKKMAECLAGWVLWRLFAANGGEWEFEEVLPGGWERSTAAGALGKNERVSAMSLTLPMAGGLPVTVRRRTHETGGGLTTGVPA